MPVPMTDEQRQDERRGERGAGDERRVDEDEERCPDHVQPESDRSLDDRAGDHDE
jgi:hypothetical protein